MIVNPAGPIVVRMDQEPDGLRLLRVDLDTLFVMSAAGRIVRQNDRDRSPGPRAFFIGGPDGNLARVRHDLDDRIAASVLEAAAKEPPWRDFNAMPECASRMVELLSAQPENVSAALIYRLPNDVSYANQATVVRDDSQDGRELLARFAGRGMPQYMQDAGFKSVADLWEPWCAALDGDDVASMCYAARLGDKGAEAGVYTFSKYRGRGLAAAVTAAWASLPALKGRALFYSTSTSNRSSQSVAARLGLRLIGASFSVA
ncbi:MAG TPA: GNAT family N-acetyltransferase [Patescibacteria group bacterium]|nr:GNAT family N-acetyltransferase [Patescibacteria group bacterium]